MTHHRDRLAEQVRGELAELVENEIADPRVGAVTVTRIDLSRDGKNLLVLVNPLDRNASERDCLRGLESARGFLQSELGARLRLRRIPEMRFAIDHGPGHTARVETLLGRLRKRAPLG